MKTRVTNLDSSDTTLVGKLVGAAFHLIKCNATNEAFDEYLPDAVDVRDMFLSFEKVDSSANAITVYPMNGSGQTIGGNASITLSSQYDTIGILSDGATWRIVYRIASVDHGALLGLSDDDHTQYLLADGTRQLAGNLAVAAAVTIDGVDISAHKAGTAASEHTAGVGTHTHQSSGAQGGKLDHGAALDGLGDDDHTIYLLIDGTRAMTGSLKMPNAGFVVFDKASGNGIRVDTGTPTFGWRDLVGKIRKRGVGATDPTDAVYRGGSVKAWQFAVNDEVWTEYHIPHDYVLGTDIHLHFHWSHNSAIVTGGSVTWGAHITYGKGHNQAVFSAEVNPTVVGNASTTQYQHIVTEVQISASSPSATQIDTDDLEPDGMLLVHLYLVANNITSGGAVPDPFLHETDIHYQSTNIATKANAPDFYA